MIFSDPRAAIQAEMRAAFPPFEARVATYYAMQEYHLGWRDLALNLANEDPGKLVRPLLVLLACQASSGDPRHALPLAAGIQLIHDFSLIHDDIEDDSATRRGRPTLWSHWGLAQGINAGDGMFVLAHLAIHRLSETGLPAERIVAILRRFDETILRICEGQFLDLSFEGDLELTTEAYLVMIERKTSVLLEAATALGATVAGATPEAAEALGRFGLSLGLAFQIQDDILGVWGDPEFTGKPFAADLYRRKLCLPVLRGLATAPRRSELAALYRENSVLDDAQVATALAILAEADARAYCVQLAAHHHEQALAALASLPPTEDEAALAARRQLQDLAQSLLGRSA